jgi:hypothetical protein
MLDAAYSAYSKKTGAKDDDLFRSELEKKPLSDGIRNEMIAELVYAKDIDIEWDEDYGTLKKILPKLYKAFDLDEDL